MSEMIIKAGLQVEATLARFIEADALPATGITPDRFWTGLADIYARFTPDNRALLETRDRLQARIDAWHEAHPGPVDFQAYEAFLREIGYLVAEPAPFSVTAENVDDEVARLAGPQLVVPVLNARFLLNAANARWGSLYDALYGTDAIPGAPAGRGYDPERGGAVIAKAKAFLDESFPLAAGSWTGATGLSVTDGRLKVGPGQGLRDPAAFVGYRGAAEAPSSILLRQHGLHVELVVDRAHPIGKDDPAGLSDIIMESALSTIVDFEDSVAVVDGPDKAAAYANWLGLMKGDLSATFDKGGREVVRRLEPDRTFTAPAGGDVVLPGRSLLFVRNVGHLMTTPAIQLPDGSEGFEGILDGVVTSLIALHDIGRKSGLPNSRAGSIYIVKPKMHGPDEAAFANRFFAAVEDLLGVAPNTIKVGLMDEERRTSANLAACIAALKDRLVFINTGFLDRTGDEIHTSMRAGAMAPKAEMRTSAWI
jgi:malate synthase